MEEQRQIKELLDLNCSGFTSHEAATDPMGIPHGKLHVGKVDIDGVRREWACPHPESENMLQKSTAEAFAFYKSQKSSFHESDQRRVGMPKELGTMNPESYLD